MVQTKQKGVYWIEKPLPRSFLGGLYTHAHRDLTLLTAISDIKTSLVDDYICISHVTRVHKSCYIHTCTHTRTDLTSLTALPDINTSFIRALRLLRVLKAESYFKVLSRMWQYAAVCCSVLQCVAVCCSVLQCLAVSCSVLQCLAGFFASCVCSKPCPFLRSYRVCCSVLRCIAVCVACVRTCVCMCMGVCVHVCVHVCVYMCAHASRSLETTRLSRRSVVYVTCVCANWCV